MTLCFQNVERGELSYAAISFHSRKSKRRETQTGTGTNVIYTSVNDIVSCVSVVQSETLRTFVPGGTITLNCKIEEFHENYFSWFRQSLGEAPTCIVTLYSGTAPVFHGDFLHEKRFTADKKGTELNLTLTDTSEADSGLYYCAARDYDLVIFSKGVFLESQDQTKDSVKLKESHHSGGSVTLQCTMLSKSCSGDHSVYWFRHTPGESPAGIIYTHGDTNSQCSRSSETDSPTQSCVYKLPKTNHSLSDPGTYYCAVAVCGQILFGNGSKLELTGEHPNWKIMALVSSNILCLIIIAVLLFARTKKRNISMSDETAQSHSLSVPTTSSVNENVERGELSYAAISFHSRKSKRRETQTGTGTNVIYTSVNGLN
ncbi:uncharacterized protein [Hoplias malabaricus]|uniref:uncharacterized protein n=1 Tax=Hoplias malabaricus TaxID=27720 RepID=UPI0034627184